MGLNFDNRVKTVYSVHPVHYSNEYSHVLTIHTLFIWPIRNVSCVILVAETNW